MGERKRRRGREREVGRNATVGMHEMLYFVII